MPDIAKLGVEVAPKGITETDKQLQNLSNTAGQTEKSTMSMMDKFRNMQAVMQGPVAAFNQITRIMGQAVAVGRDLVNTYAIQERAVSNLEAVLRATGGTVGMTSQELQDMASSFQQVTLFGDEAIIQMNAVLLGFRSIQGDTFERTTEAILDMSTVMGTDLVSSANMLGKALDSPTQGMSALSRVGFVWTDQQREMVKAMEESGDLLGAQNIILGEVEKAFGGAAKAAGETATGAFQKLNMAVGDFKEGLGQTIAEGLNPFVEWLTTAITKVNEFNSAIRKAEQTAVGITKIADLVAKGDAGVLASATQGVDTAILVEALRLAIAANPLATQRQATAIRQLESIINTRLRTSGSSQLGGTPTTVGATGGAPSSSAGVVSDLFYGMENIFPQPAEFPGGAVIGAENIFPEPPPGTVEEVDAYAEAMKQVKTALSQTLQSGSIDALKDLGEAWASGANAGDSFAQSIADVGLAILNQLPLLLLQAGVSVIGVNPVAGLALIAASGLVAIGAGAANSAASGGGGTITANALGNVYNSPSLSAYSGGVYTSPQLFAFARGGVFAEAGPEAIMPLSRGSDGKLGVKASGGGVNVIVNNYATDSQVSQREETGPNGEKQIIVTVENIMKQAIANGRMDGVMSRFGSRAIGVRV